MTAFCTLSLRLLQGQPLNLICCRYNHKLMKLAEAVLREVVDFKVEEDRFQVSLPHYIITSTCPA